MTRRRPPKRNFTTPQAQAVDVSKRGTSFSGTKVLSPHNPTFAYTRPEIHFGRNQQVEYLITLLNEASARQHLATATSVFELDKPLQPCLTRDRANSYLTQILDDMDDVFEAYTAQALTGTSYCTRRIAGSANESLVYLIEPAGEEDDASFLERFRKKSRQPQDSEVSVKTGTGRSRALTPESADDGDASDISEQP